MTQENGYTLIEMMVVIGIIAIIFPALFLGIQSLYHTHAYTFARAQALSEADKGLKEMLGDIRSATYAEDGSLPVASIGTSSLIIYTDTGSDRRAERVRYFFDGTTIKKGVITPTATSSYPTTNEIVQTLVQHTANQTLNIPLFTYYDANGNELDPAFDSILEVERIKVTLPIHILFDGTQAGVTLTSSASIRNLKHVY